MNAELIQATDVGIETQGTFRDAMAALAATVCVVTAADGNNRIGRTVTAALSLAIDPPSLLVSIDAGARLSALIRAQGGFSFAMLQSDQQTVAEAFAGKVEPNHRFDHGLWDTWPSGHPRLRGAVAAMDCVLTGEFEINDHVLFVGQPQHIALSDTRSPLVWHGRRFNTATAL